MTQRATRRGLVLGGGGVLGAAWSVGALTAIEYLNGIDLRDCEVIVGTSAGSVLAGLLASGVSVAQLRAHQLGEVIDAGPLAGFTWDYERATGGARPPLPRLLGPGSGRLVARSLVNGRRMPPTAVLAGVLPLGRGSLTRVGHLIDAVTPMGEWAPHHNLWIVTMDFESGKRVAFGRPGAPAAGLSAAVMASCAIPGWFAPIQIAGRRYVDGGACSATSVDLLTDRGLDEVYVVAPMVSFATDHPTALLTKLERSWRLRATRRCLVEVERVRAGGTSVTVLGPGPEDLMVMGANNMNSTRRRQVLDTSLATSIAALCDPDHGGPDYLAHVG